MSGTVSATAGMSPPPPAADVRALQVEPGPTDVAVAASAALAAGDVAAAGLYLRRAVTLDPVHVACLGNLAAYTQQLGIDAAPSMWLRRLLTLDPEDVAALIDLARVERNPPASRNPCRRALVLAPAEPAAWEQIGGMLLDGAPAVAAAAFARAMTVGRASAAMLLGAGLARARLGRAHAARLINRGLALAPDRFDAWYAIAALPEPASLPDRLRAGLRAVAIDPESAAGWHRLGECLWQARQAKAAAQCYRVALALAPPLVEAMANLAVALRELARDAPVPWFRRAVAQAPEHPIALTNLGTTLPPGSPRAIQWHRRALAREPVEVHALNNLGSQHLALNELAAAIAWFQRAIDGGRGGSEAIWNRGAARLLSGDLLRGFADHESRWGLRVLAGWERSHPQPVWRGEPAAGRTLLVHAEQGLGDTLQFVRYLAPLADAGWRVILECQPALVRLLSRAPGVTATIARGDPLPPFDRHVPLLSMAHRFGTTLTTIPAPVPYLATRSEAPKPLQGLTGRTIGLVWAGNPEHRNDGNRSLDVASLGRLLRGLRGLAGVSVVSLQLGARAAELAEAGRAGLDVLDLSPTLTDFEATAAAISALDLVIGVDTAVMHLTGALGRPGLLLLPYAPDWRWLLERSDSPWYPTLRLYRQAEPGQWAAPIDAVLAGLRRP